MQTLQNKQKWSELWRKTKLAAIVVCAMALAALAGGFYGHSLPKSGVDPQDYMTTVFTPYEDGQAAYLKFLDGTRSKLRVAIYSYTNDAVTDKIVELKKRGVNDIKVIVDRSQSVSRTAEHQQEQINRLRAAGIEVLVGTSEKKSQIMHLKFTVRDDQWVEDGSWNYSVSANNQNNNLNFVESKKRAAQFTANWDRMARFIKTQDQTPWDKTD
jgi:phosphatidylserine/phosphatidylglycerophosphate/cardiolipin synthase-like enzyme